MEEMSNTIVLPYLKNMYICNLENTKKDFYFLLGLDT